MSNAAEAERTNVLVVEDDPQEREMLAETIRSLGHHAETACDGEEALDRLDSAGIDVILTDLIMPRVDGMELLRTLASRGDRRPAIVLTGYGSIERAIAIVHDLRAFWFLEKPARKAVLGALLERAMAHRKLIGQVEVLERQKMSNGFLGDLYGESRVMQQVFALMHRVAPTAASVFITGESGTGKELVANAIHRLSPRANGPFVAVNCAALPETLIESELFGHEKGSFTGAISRRAGCFEQADGGTMFLDEISEMPLSMQVKLLRVLQESKVRRIGGSAENPVDVRVLAASNRDLSELMNQKLFREDLFYRLNVFQIQLPPLRNRPEDIPGLVNTIVGHLNTRHGYRVTEIHPAALEKLAGHTWSGNVRELRNVLERAVILAHDGTLLPEHLPHLYDSRPARAASQSVTALPAQAETNGVAMTPGKPLKEIEKSYILMTLKQAGNNKTLAAKRLGISLRTLHNRLSEFAHEAASAAAAGQGAASEA